MSNSTEGDVNTAEKKYKGVRRRKWGKWVSEIRVPGTRERLWLGSYSTAEAAAVAHDTALYYLRGPSFIEHLNFPMCLPVCLRTNMSPKSIQKVASEAGMAIDAELATNLHGNEEKLIENVEIQSLESQFWEDENENCNNLGEGQELSISVDDIEICI